jgi:Aspartyl protease/PDZ domain
MKRLLTAAAALLLLSGCFSIHRPAPMPGLTYVGSKPVTLPCRLLGNILVVETKWDKFGPYHFVIDTGSSVTLVSPELALRYGDPNEPAPDVPKVRVRSSQGSTRLLDAVALTKIQLGKARFEYVPALVFNCDDLSALFGVHIDGILGFPLFRNAVLTLDYPHSQIVLRSDIPEEGLPGETILFNNEDKTPLIPIRLGDREFAALIDSGSTAAIAVNPAGLSPKFSFGPVDGPVVNTLSGDETSSVGRLADVVRMGSFDIAQPVADMTDELSSLGGGILRHFTVTFDQRDNEVFFQHDPADSLSMPALRGTGLSFRKTPAYWKVVGVVAASPAGEIGVRPGDLVSRINGEPVGHWDIVRYDHLVDTAAWIDFTFIDGSREALTRLRVVDIVP